VRGFYPVDEVFEVFLDRFVLAFAQRHLDVFSEGLHQQPQQSVDFFFGRFVRQALLVEVVFHGRAGHVLGAVVAVLVVAFEGRPDFSGPLVFLDVFDAQRFAFWVESWLADAEEGGAAGDPLERHAG